MRSPRRTVGLLLAICLVGVLVLLWANRELEDLVARTGGGESAATQFRVVLPDGTPVPGAIVGDGSSTDAQGRFTRTPDQAGGPLTVRLGPLQAQIVDRARSGGDVRLPGSFRLAGLVLRRGDRAPVAGASLDCGGREGRSDAGGSFVLSDVPSKILLAPDPVLRVSAPGFVDQDWPISREALPPTFGDLLLLLEEAR